MEVYLETTILNISLFYLLLIKMVQTIFNDKIKKANLFLGIVAGVFFAILSKQVVFPVVINAFYKIILMFLVLLICFKNCSVFARMITTLCAGLFFDGVFLFLSKLFFLKVEVTSIYFLIFLLLSLLPAYLILKLVNAVIIKNKLKKFYYKVKLTNGNSVVEVDAYLDTGNILIDENTNKPVFIIDFLTFLKLAPKARNSVNGYYINYKTVATCNKMFVFKVDKVCLVGKNEEVLDVVLGVSVCGFGKNKDFSMLLNPLALKL